MGEFDQISIMSYIILSDRNVKVISGVSMDSDRRLLVMDLRVVAESKEEEC